MTIIEWQEQQKSRQGYYAHFDLRLPLLHCLGEITSPDFVKSYGFFPFIHYTKTIRRVKNGHALEPKKREIFYAAHKDSWIYRYYAFLLNKAYNTRALTDGIDHVAVAYRNNHPGKSNVHFARQAFNFIRKCQSCFIMIGDFTSFFDNLNHSYLKERLCDLLDVTQLPSDYAHNTDAIREQTNKILSTISFDLHRSFVHSFTPLRTRAWTKYGQTPFSTQKKELPHF